ncbi:MAG: CoA transferase subunit A [Acidobacteria bacterium]|nr:CoA transferase subunit A [Acidobacteriota bacterium]
MNVNKICSLGDAVSELVHDGCSLAISTDLEQRIPFAAAHEIIRQRKRELTLMAPISDMLADQMIAGGTIARVLAAWVGNVSAGLGHNFRRAVESGIPHHVEMVDYSNFTMALALKAGAMGVPFIPTRSTLGSDLLRRNPGLEPLTDARTGEELVAVRALRPDVAIVHVQRSDEDGNCHVWGNLGVTLEAVRASRRTLVIAEEVVSRQVIVSDPNRTLIPGFLVHAVVHQPWGAHPSPVQGYYNRDHRFFSDYHHQTRTWEGTKQWLGEWVYQVADREEYLCRIDREPLLLKNHAPAAPVDYGF